MTDTRQFVLNVAAASTAPSWFNEQTDNTWVAVAGGPSFSADSRFTGDRMLEVRPTANYGTFNQVTRAWNSGWVMQSTGEIGQHASGGHNSWHGNEAYALALRTERPGWVRIIEPTPDALTLRTDPVFNAPFDANVDGTPRTAHGYQSGRIASNDRLWVFATADGPIPVVTSNVWSAPRNGTGAPSDWMYHGRWQGPSYTPYGAGLTYGPAAHDPLTDTIYLSHSEAGTLANKACAINVAAAVAAGPQSTTLGPQVPGSTLFDCPYGSRVFNDVWSEIVNLNGHKAWICGSNTSANIYVRDVSNVGASNWQAFAPSGTPPGGYGIKMGCGYHAPSQSLLVFGMQSENTAPADAAKVWKLAIPDNPFGPGYAWTLVANSPGGTLPSLPAADLSLGAYGGTYGRARLIQNMGNGRGALVMHTSTQGPVFVYKLPAGAV